MLFNTAKVMSKGQITLPIDMRRKLKLKPGDSVALICEEGRVVITNPAVSAMESLTAAMEGEWEKAGIRGEDDIVDLCREMRREAMAR